MKVAILGGTGKLGLAFAIRLSKSEHEVVIGSRDAAKAVEAAMTVGTHVRALTNVEAANWGDAAFVSVPHASHRSLLESVRPQLQGKIIVDATVPIDPANILQIRSNSGKSAAEETAAIIDSAHVFAAFQTTSHRVLRRADAVEEVLIAGGSSRKAEVMQLIRSMGLPPIDAGPLEVARHLERLTVLLLSINKANKVKESGIKITGL
jgi:NADPH-dependent F420 reductase